MNLESTLYYITHHSESIIQWLFLSILVMACFVIARGLFGKKEGHAAQGAGSSASTGVGVGMGNTEIQTFLQKILDQTAKLETVSLEKMNPAVMGQVETQVASLKQDLQSREEELAKLKASGNTQVPADAAALGARIKELEAKLAEYEILEDDIADLSLYKEENARLKVELEKVKGGAPEAAAGEPPPPPAPAISPGEDIVAEFAQAVGQDAAPPPEAAQPEASAPIPAPVPIAAAEPAAAPPPPPSAPGTPMEGDDLFAEFAQAAAETDAPLDTDKMMEEMAALVSVEPSKGTALEDSIDTEKMALEATNLTKS